MARAKLYSAISAGTGDDAAIVKSTGGTVYSVNASNVNAAVRYIKLYNMAGSPVTTDTPILRIAVPGATTGGVRDISFPLGVAFPRGIGVRIVTGAADSDGTDVASAELLVNIGYE